MSAKPTSEQPWYAAGLRFGCTRCGACCTGAPGFVWVDDAEVQALANFTGETRARFLALYTRTGPRGRTLRERANGDCVLFATGQGCTVYPVRPRQCRTWPFWDSNLATPADWEETRQACPGAGQGPLIPAEEITRRLREIKL